MKNLLQIQLNTLKSTGFTKSGQRQKMNTFFGLLFAKIFKSRTGENMYGFSRANDGVLSAGIKNTGGSKSAVKFLKNMFAGNKTPHEAAVKPSQDNLPGSVFPRAPRSAGSKTQMLQSILANNNGSADLNDKSASELLENNPEFLKFKQIVTAKLTAQKGAADKSFEGQMLDTGLELFFSISQLLHKRTQKGNEGSETQLKLKNGLQLEYNQQNLDKPVTVAAESRSAAKNIKNILNIIQGAAGEEILNSTGFRIMSGTENQSAADKIQDFTDFEKFVLSKLSLAEGTRKNAAEVGITQTGLKSYFSIQQLLNGGRNSDVSSKVKFKLTDTLQIEYDQQKSGNPVTVFTQNSLDENKLKAQLNTIEKITGGNLLGSVRFEIQTAGNAQTSSLMQASGMQEFADFQKGILAGLSSAKGAAQTAAVKLSQPAIKSFFTIRQFLNDSSQNQKNSGTETVKITENLQLNFNTKNLKKPAAVFAADGQAVKQLQAQFEAIQKITGENILDKISFGTLAAKDGKSQAMIPNNTAAQNVNQMLTNTLKEYSVNENQILQKLSAGLSKSQLNDQSFQTALKSYFTVRELAAGSRVSKTEKPVTLKISADLQVVHHPGNGKKAVSIQVPDKQAVKQVKKQLNVIQKITGENVLSSVRIEMTPKKTKRNDTVILNNKNAEKSVPVQNQASESGTISKDIPPLQRKNMTAEQTNTGTDSSGHKNSRQDLLKPENTNTLKQGTSDKSAVKQETENSFSENIKNQIKNGGAENKADGDLFRQTAAKPADHIPAETVQPNTQQRSTGLADRIRETILKYDWTKNRLGLKANFKIENSPVGRMEIQFIEKGRKKNVQIYVESENAKAEIQKILPQVQQSLAQKAVNLEVITVNVSNFSLSSEQFRENQRKRDRTPHSAANMKEVQNEQTESAVDKKNYGYNTIEVVA